MRCPIWILAATVVGGCLALAGCDTKARPGLPCERDGDCPTGFICADELCGPFQCVSAGDCPLGQECIDHRCALPTDCDGDEDCAPPTPRCDLEQGRCVGCLPDCSGRVCGNDGCNGSCGTCPTGESCTAAGQCQACAPDCSGRVCGPDPVCGTSCGTCPTGESCTAAGQCEACVPDCGGRDCGPDPVCNQSCGTCPAGQICTASGTCQGGGCQSDGDCQAPTPYCELSSRDCVQCLEAGHCAAGQICSGGQCAEVPRCTADGQCEIGQICEDGACVTGCRSNRDCPSPQTCLTSLGEHGTCIDCERPEDCPDGQTCQSYRCVPWCTRDEHCAPLFCNTQTHQCVPCTLDSHCVAGEICQTFACVPGCRRDSDCDSGHCLVAEFRCVQCLGLDDCALGSLCLEYACVVGCRDARDCPAGLQCDPALGPHGTCVQCLGNTDCSASERCVDGLCQFYCSSDASCAPPSPACDTSRGVCVACTSSTHCAAGTICLEQACVPGCVNDRDCPGGMFCEPSLGEHGSCVQCLRDQDCGTGFACEQNRCVLQGSDMIRLPGTVFNRGSPDGVGEPDERPMKAIGLPTYYLDRAEVTNAQYRACVQAGVCSAPSDPTAYDAPSHADHPVVFVTYQQATNFCGWVGKGLPTEARWERAARGDGALDRTYPWGDQAPNCSRAVYTGCQTPDATMPVGSKPSGATPEGALDLAGNVWEWCYDRYSETYYTDSSVAYDPVGPLEGSMRVVRGGAFNSLPAALRSANRASRDPGLGYEDVGFRCALRGSPVADFALTPQTGPFATTNFGVDASLTTDPNHPVDLLEVRWDWENDGTFDTAWTTAKSASRRYAFPGVFRIKLEARDPDGNTDTRTRKVGAIGSDGWQGAVCASNQECAPGFKCVLSWSTFQSYCREDCGLLDSECVLPGLSCQFYFDLVNPDPVGMACFGE